MGYQQGEIPMTNVHGQSVAGATFPVPIWHEYMAAALWNRPALDFPTPNSYPSYHYLDEGLLRARPVLRAAGAVPTTTTTVDAPGEADEAVAAAAAAYTRRGEQLAPAGAEHGAGRALARRPRGRASASRRPKSSSPASRVIAAASAVGIVRRHEERRLPVVRAARAPRRCRR